MPASGKNPRSRRTWVTGTKLIFLDQYSPDWQQAVDAGVVQAGAFYTKVAKHFIKKYGWHFNRWTDSDDVQELDEATLDDEEPQDGLTDEEVTERNKYFHELRAAILSWYHNHNSKVSKADNGELEQMLLNIAGEEPKLPRTKQITQYYSNKYYATRIKPAFEAAMAIERAKPAEDRVAHIAVRNRVTNEAWAAEPETFTTWLTEERDTAHKKLVKEFKEKVAESRKDPCSPESYHAVLSNAAGLLQPFADLMSKKFGAAVSILMVCPIGSKNGQVELRSVHSGVTKDLTPLTWPEYDHTGFDAVQQSMVNFGNRVFTSPDQQARALHIARELTPTSDALPGASTSTLSGSSDPSPPPTMPHSRSSSPVLASNIALSPPPPSLPSRPSSPLPPPPPSRPSSPPPPPPPSPTPCLPSQRSPSPSTMRHLPRVSTPVPGSPSGVVLSGARINEMPLHSQVAYEVVLRDSSALGEQWSDCVAAFIEFERAAGFMNKDFRLPNSTLRPVEIKRWFGASRKVSGNIWVALGTGDAGDFSRRWCEWWMDLQPPGRPCDQSGTLLKTTDIDWSPLSKPGGSGMYLVLVCLVWWRQMSGIATTTNDWLAAVADVTWVLGQLKDRCNVLQLAQSTQSKRKMPDTENAEAPHTGGRLKRKTWKAAA